MVFLVSFEPVEHLVVGGGLRIFDRWVLVLANDSES